MESTKQKGDKGELIAIGYLQRNGYQIVETNYKFGRFGEIDIIAKNSGNYYFIEVKYRSNQNFGTAEESITPNKLYKLEKSIYAYCLKNSIDLEKICFQVIAITKKQASHELKHYKNIALS